MNEKRGRAITVYCLPFTIHHSLLSLPVIIHVKYLKLLHRGLHLQDQRNMKSGALEIINPNCVRARVKIN